MSLLQCHQREHLSGSPCEDALLKCSSDQVHKATDAEWLGAELSKTLATELLKSHQRSGQRGYVDVETDGQPTEEPPADTRDQT